MIHRVLLGSVERFFATLVEHYGGKFPLWLAPVQVSVISISQDEADYVEKIKKYLEDAGFRVETDVRDETMQKKIRDKEMQKIPYTVVLGKKEKEAQTISVRRRGMEPLGSMTPEVFVQMLKKET